MKDSRHIIWTDYLDYDDWKEDLEAQYPELSANERMNLMYEINGTYFQDEKTNLDISAWSICNIFIGYVPYYVSYIAIWAMENQKWRYYCGCQK